MFRLLLLLLLTSGPVWAAKACREHGGVASCVNGHVLCKDGSVDKRYNCTTVTHKRTAKQTVKFKKKPNRGQIQEPGEPPPESTLEDSRKALNP